MATFNELMQRFVNESYDSLLNIANQSLRDVSNALTDFFSDKPEYATQSTVMLFACCLGADGKLTELEARFLNDLLCANHSYSTLCTMISTHANKDSLEIIDKLVDTLDQDSRAAMLTLATCFLAVDETITREEVALISLLMA